MIRAAAAILVAATTFFFTLAAWYGVTATAIAFGVVTGLVSVLVLIRTLIAADRHRPQHRR